MTLPDKLLLPARRRAIPIHFVDRRWLGKPRRRPRSGGRAAAREQGFSAEAGRTLLLTGKDGAMRAFCSAWARIPPRKIPFLPGKLAQLLPPAPIASRASFQRPRLAALGWLLEAYSFNRYRHSPIPLLPSSAPGPRPRWSHTRG